MLQNILDEDMTNKIDSNTLEYGKNSNIDENLIFSSLEKKLNESDMNKLEELYISLNYLQDEERIKKIKQKLSSIISKKSNRELRNFFKLALFDIDSYCFKKSYYDCIHNPDLSKEFFEENFEEFECWFSKNPIEDSAISICNIECLNVYLEKKQRNENESIYICNNSYISESNVRKILTSFNKEPDWEYLAFNKNLSEKFWMDILEKYKNFKEWNNLSSNYNLTDNFWYKYIDKIDQDVKYLYGNDFLSDTFFDFLLEKYFFKVNFSCLVCNINEKFLLKLMKNEKYNKLISIDLLCMNHKLSENFVDTFIIPNTEEIEWYFLSCNKNLSEAFWKKHMDDNLNYISLFNRNFSDDFYTNYLSKNNYDTCLSYYYNKVSFELLKKHNIFHYFFSNSNTPESYIEELLKNKPIPFSLESCTHYSPEFRKKYKIKSIFFSLYIEKQRKELFSKFSIFKKIPFYIF